MCVCVCLCTHTMLSIQPHKASEQHTAIPIPPRPSQQHSEIYCTLFGQTGSVRFASYCLAFSVHLLFNWWSSVLSTVRYDVLHAWKRLIRKAYKCATFRTFVCFSVPAIFRRARSRTKRSKRCCRCFGICTTLGCIHRTRVYCQADDVFYFVLVCFSLTVGHTQTVDDAIPGLSLYSTYSIQCWTKKTIDKNICGLICSHLWLYGGLTSICPASELVTQCDFCMHMYALRSGFEWYGSDMLRSLPTKLTPWHVYKCALEQTGAWDGVCKIGWWICYSFGIAIVGPE